MIPAWRWFIGTGFRVSLVGLAVAGGGIGYITGIVSNTGPINMPFFLADRLTKGAFVGTDAISSLAMFSPKALAFRYLGTLPPQTIVSGLMADGRHLFGQTVFTAHQREHFRGLDGCPFMCLWSGHDNERGLNNPAFWVPFVIVGHGYGRLHGLFSFVNSVPA